MSQGGRRGLNLVMHRYILKIAAVTWLLITIIAIPPAYTSGKTVARVTDIVEDGTNYNEGASRKLRILARVWEGSTIVLSRNASLALHFSVNRTDLSFTGRDGMSGTGFGMPDILSPIGALVIRTFDLGNGVAAGDQEKIVEGSPTLAVFSSPSDTLPHWLATGQSLSRVLLSLTDAGATASYLNPPVELEELRPRLRELVKCKGTPQLLMRFGYGPSAAPTVRREVDDVLIS